MVKVFSIIQKYIQVGMASGLVSYGESNFIILQHIQAIQELPRGNKKTQFEFMASD